VTSPEALDRAELAVLGREYLLAGHLIDRSGMPQVIATLGTDVMRDVAIDEWMGASPVYTRRIQELLGFRDDDVATIFKGMQFDIGAPHEFMDFRYTVHDRHHGEFALRSCGALLDVEPMGDELVVAMCHHIEDPTFDATACATNPRARMRPVHRPPRSPADRHPHCHWTVSIDPDDDPLPEPVAAERMARARAASVPLPGFDPDPGPGLDDYAGPLDPDLRLEQFSRSVLLAVVDELALQGHLLSLSFLAAVGDRTDAETARSLGTKQFTGIAGLTAARLRNAFGLGSGVDDIAAVLGLHPAFRPRAYVTLRSTVVDDRLVVALADSDALHEEIAPSWMSLLADDPSPMEAIVQAVDPQARVDVRGPTRNAVMTWEIVHDEDLVPRPEPDEVLLTRFSTGADFVFTHR
jgi:hypothetical protein